MITIWIVKDQFSQSYASICEIIVHASAIDTIGISNSVVSAVVFTFTLE